MREWYFDYFVLGLPTIGLHEYHPDYYQLSHSWLYSIGGGLRFQSNQPYLSPIQHLSQRFPENKGCKIGVDKKILICFRYYLQNEVHVALLDVKWVILHRKFALKICTIHSWYGNLIIFSLVQAIVVKLRIWAYAKTSISSNEECRSTNSKLVSQKVKGQTVQGQTFFSWSSMPLGNYKEMKLIS